MLRIEQLFRLQPPSAPDDAGCEFRQWQLRFVVMAITILGSFTATSITADSLRLAPWLRDFLLACIVYAVVGIALRWWTKKRPGHYPVRRIAAIVLDACALSFGIILNPWVTLPLYAALVWIVAGNGVRYGQTYLIISAVVVQLALLAIYFLGPFTVVETHVAITLSLAAIVLPVHSYFMLQSIASARNAAEDASRSKSQFLAQASHDLRQPLHASKLLIGNLREKDLPSEQLAIVDRIDRSLDSVCSLFRSLLEASLLDSGKLMPKSERIELGSFIKEIVAENSTAAEWANCRIRVVHSTKTIICDRVLLASMARNLLSNAIKYSGGCDILIGPRRRGPALAIEVWDQGPGIDADEQLNVFEEFYQVRKIGDKDKPGVGLGLSIVRRLADLLNLHVALLSRVGKGTCVGIYGLTEAPRLAPVIKSNPKIPSSSILPMRGFRVLLIEDDADCRYATEDLLLSWGCHVASWDTVPKVVQPEFDLLLTDFDLGGGVTGVDAINKYRAVSGQMAPVLMLTGHDRAMYQELLGDADVMILKKPFAPAELRSLLNSIRVGFSRTFSEVIQ